MPEYATTQIAAAAKLGITRSALIEWASNPDFPKKTKTRGWNLDKIRLWAKKHGRGEHRKSGGGRSTTTDGVTLAEANIRKTVEQAENERIKKERQLVEQARELQDIVLVSDVLHLYEQTVATVSAVNDSLTDAIDRAMPETPPSAEAYLEIRTRVMGLCGKLAADASSAMQELAEG